MAKRRGGSADELLEFAAAAKSRSGPPCVICSLPERSVIDDARRRAPARHVGGYVVREWLIEEHGYTEKTAPSQHQFNHHFSKGHHLEGA